MINTSTNDYLLHFFLLLGRWILGGAPDKRASFRIDKKSPWWVPPKYVNLRWLDNGATMNTKMSTVDHLFYFLHLSTWGWEQARERRVHRLVRDKSRCSSKILISRFKMTNLVVIRDSSWAMTNMCWRWWEVFAPRDEATLLFPLEMYWYWCNFSDVNLERQNLSMQFCPVKY